MDDRTSLKKQRSVMPCGEHETNQKFGWCSHVGALGGSRYTFQVASRLVEFCALKAVLYGSRSGVGSDKWRGRAVGGRKDLYRYC